jgi:hypothetical protein
MWHKRLEDVKVDVKVRVKVTRGDTRDGSDGCRGMI